MWYYHYIGRQQHNGANHMNKYLEQRFVIVADDGEGRILAEHANSGRNGGEDNYTYKTLAGAKRKMAKITHMVRIQIFEVEYDDQEGDEVGASHAAEDQAKALWL